MSLQMSCPSCATPLSIPDTMLNKKARCKRCQEVFVVTGKKGTATGEDAQAGRAEERLQEKPDFKSRPSARRIEGEDEAPARSQARKQDREGTRSSRGLIISGVAGVLVLAGAGLGVWLSIKPSAAPAPHVAAVVPGKQAAPAQPKPAQSEPAHPEPAQPIPAQAANPAPQKPAQPEAPVQPANPAQPVAIAPPAKPAQPANPAPPVDPTPLADPAPRIPPKPKLGPPSGLRHQWQGGPHVFAVLVEADEENGIRVREGHCVVQVKPGDRPKGPIPVLQATGSGFIVNANGYLVTCAHVVSDASKVEVILGGKTYPGTVVGVDDDHDIAVVKIEAKNLPTVPLGSSEKAEVGMEVRALGFPLSSILGDNLKATRGTLSGINKEEDRKVLQIDATLNPGNSGGPLVTETGAVLGVNSARLTGDANKVGFAAPIDEVKRLLKEKSVSFVEAKGGPKLEGPQLVKSIAPSVALFRVTLDASGPERCKLTFTGKLIEKQQAMPGEAAPANAPKGKESTLGSELEIDARGHLIQVQTTNGQLPFLLGDLGSFFVDLLPMGNRDSWQQKSVVSFGQSAPRPNPGLPARFHVPPIRIPGMRPRPAAPPPPPPPANARKATERTVYKRGVAAGDTLTLTKHYELNAPPAGDAPGVGLILDGPITFDTRSGMPREAVFHGTFSLTSRTLTARFPLRVTYKLLEGEERENVLHPPLPKLSDAAVAKALSDLKGTDRNRMKAAMDLLGKHQATVQRAEIARAINPWLADKDFWVLLSSIQAASVWGTRENIPALGKLVSDQNPFIRGAALKALGKSRAPAAVEAVAKSLVIGYARVDAARTLQEMGSVAEKTVLPYLKNKDGWVRLDVCKTLNVIGTRTSLPALEEAARDKDLTGLIAQEAKAAIEAVKARE